MDFTCSECPVPKINFGLRFFIDSFSNEIKVLKTFGQQFVSVINFEFNILNVTLFNVTFVFINYDFRVK